MNNLLNNSNWNNIIFNTAEFLKSEATNGYYSNYPNQGYDIIPNPISTEFNNYKEQKENNNMDFGNMFNGMFKPCPKGNCKMAMNGKVAVKTATGYKTFDINTNKLTNCDNFAFDMDGMFWIVPTFKVERGDIIIVNNKPRAVIEVNKNSIKTFSYDDSTIVETVPEHHVFMGKTYCYGKIFSPFMNMGKSDEAMSGMMRMMMFIQMFGGNNGNGNFSNNMNGFNPMMFMFMGGNGSSNMFENMFDGAFDFGGAANEIAETATTKED